MPPLPATSAPRRRLPLRLLRLALPLTAIVTCGYLVLWLFLAAPWTVRQASRLLTGRLGRPATVAGLRLSGMSLTVRGVRIANPPSFDGGLLAEARSVLLTPDLPGILGGSASFRLVRVDGLSVTLRQNSAGTWNLAGLGERPGARKSARETLVKRLVLTGASLRVNGRGLDNIGLSVSDLATRGSSDSRVRLAFRDDFGSSYRLEGNVRLGPTPAVDLSLTAPAVDMRILEGMKLPLHLAGGTATLQLAAGFQGGRLALEGETRFDRPALRLETGLFPIRGRAGFKAGYDLAGDAAVLERCTLDLDGLVSLRASGRVRELKGRRVFDAEIAVADVELHRLADLLPPGALRGLAVAGRLRSGRLKLAGDGRRGITAGRGGVALTGGELSRGGKPLLRGVAGDVAVARVERG